MFGKELKNTPGLSSPGGNFKYIVHIYSLEKKIVRNFNEKCLLLSLGLVFTCKNNHLNIQTLKFRKLALIYINLSFFIATTLFHGSVRLLLLLSCFDLPCSSLRFLLSFEAVKKTNVEAEVVQNEQKHPNEHSNVGQIKDDLCYLLVMVAGVFP